jgi:DNA-binding MarR family transcriptional regulator
MRSTNPRPQTFRPAANPAERVGVRLGEVTFRMLHEMEQVLKPYGLTSIQYNALRILNGAGPDGLCGTEVAERLITKAPDVPRLLERMQEAGLITRERDPDNRRFVRARITPLGVQRLVDSYPALVELHARQWRGLSVDDLRTLETILDRVAASA